MKWIYFIANEFGNFRKDSKRLTDIKLNTIETRLTQADLMVFREDPSEGYEGQTQKSLIMLLLRSKEVNV